MKLEQKQRILFIGDSITDAGRNRENPYDLGMGYPLFVSGALGAKYPNYQLTFLNRGIGGNKIADLLARTEADCRALKPNSIVLLIGINDVWHNVDRESFATEESVLAFERQYRQLLDEYQKVTSNILILEPFVLNYPIDRMNWRADLDPKIQVIRRLAQEYQCEFVALDGPLNEKALASSSKIYTGEDGVHPTSVGHYEIAQRVIAHFEP